MHIPFSALSALDLQANIHTGLAKTDRGDIGKQP